MRRRAFINTTAGLLAGLTAARAATEAAGASATPPRGPLTLFLAGDVMTGRGIDQALPQSAPPELHEPYVTSAGDYVRLAETANGALDLPLGYAYPWGDALAELERVRPALRLVNLETAITERGEPSPEKAIHYRMHPGNVPCLTAAGLDGVTLANNHVLDWGVTGLQDSLDTLAKAGIRVTGAGPDAAAAAAPQPFETAAGRLLFLGACTGYSGVPRSWAAGPAAPGVNRIGLDESSVQAVTAAFDRVRRPGDRAVLSLHWGGNWGYDIPSEHRDFAHRLIDEAGVDLLHGHSSHHPRGIEIYRGRAILYGCGDFLNDYEGIRGDKQRFRGELTLMYFPTLAADGGITDFELVPLRIRRFRLQHATADEADWLAAMLDRESRPLGARAELSADHRIHLRPA